MKIAVLGAGAAGYFSAIHAKESCPSAEVILFEKTHKPLAKVKISGGGRCNVCHDCFQVNELAAHYPRGEKFLKKSFRHFATENTIHWFEENGVALKVEADGRMFPVTDSSQTIIDCLERKVNQLGIKQLYGCDIGQIRQTGSSWQLISRKGENFQLDKVIIATGGSPKKEGLAWLEKLGLQIQTPVPSLFTFNMPAEKTADLMGLSVPKVIAKVAGTKLKSEGPLLFTHWGMSGPAILKLSAWGARILSEKQYHFQLIVQWLPEKTEETLRNEIPQFRADIPKRKLGNRNPFQLPGRLWEFLLEKHQISAEQEWGQLDKKSGNRLISALLQDPYQVKGKTTFKEEFVTCGGIDLSEVDHSTLEAKKLPGLYFAGEVLDIDGITGGFNFQAAWTTGFLAGTSAGKSLLEANNA